MRTEKKSYKEYWDELALIMNIGDTILCDVNSDGDTIIIFKNCCGCVLNTYNVDEEEVMYY